MSFKAIQDKVIIKVTAVEEKTDSGLFIPDTAASLPSRGVVVAAGPGVYSGGTFVENSIKVGDNVVFSPRAAQHLEVDGEDYLVFLSEHILAVLE